MKTSTEALAGVAQLVRLKGNGFDSCSGHVPRFWVRSVFLLHIEVSLSLPLSLSKQWKKVLR